MMLPSHKPWEPWRYVTDAGAAGKTVQEYRDHETMLRLRMPPREFGQLTHIMTAAEITTRAILAMMDMTPNVLGPDETEDKP